MCACWAIECTQKAPTHAFKVHLSRAMVRQLSAEQQAAVAAAKFKWWLSVNDEHVRFFIILFNFFFIICSVSFLWNFSVCLWKDINGLLFFASSPVDFSGYLVTNYTLIYYFVPFYAKQAGRRVVGQCLSLDPIAMPPHTRTPHAHQTIRSIFFLIWCDSISLRVHRPSATNEKAACVRVWRLSMLQSQRRLRSINIVFTDKFEQEMSCLDFFSRSFRYNFFSTVFFPSVVVIGSRELNCSNFGNDDAER